MARRACGGARWLFQRHNDLQPPFAVRHDVSWSTYAFTGNDAQLVQLRQGESFTEEEAARLAGLSGAHELGHQLLHLSHPFGQPACLMYPVPMFSYGEWAAKLSASQCRPGSNPAVTPGAYKGFTY